MSEKREEIKKKLILTAVLSVVACIVSSLVGMLVGGFMNLIAKLMGDSYQSIAVMVSIILFVGTFALSFFANKKITHWFFQSKYSKRFL
jgi:ABC-type dipeptide/oligopeptide/nickel transport system permease component